VVSRRTLDGIGVTIVRFANGVEAWLKPTDFKNDQVLFTMAAPGGSSLAPETDYTEASLATALVSAAGAGGLKATDLQKVLTGKLVVARPFISLSTHGVSGSAPPAQLETALQLLYQEVTAPGEDAESFALLKKQLDAAVANRGRSPQQIFGEKLSQLNTSNHYTAQPLTPERVQALSREKMIAYYRERFANAADFTFFMVGAFKVDDVVPLLAQYVGSLPSKGQPSSTFKDVGLRFPAATQEAKVEAGREPRGQTVISFFADPSIDPMEQEQIIAATTVLDIALRDILREDLGQTYTVGVGLSQPLPQRGAGHIEVRFGAAPDRSHEPRQGVCPPRVRDRAEDQRLLAGTAADREDVRSRPGRDPDAPTPNRCRDAAGAAGDLQEVLPERSIDHRHARAGADTGLALDPCNVRDAIFSSCGAGRARLNT
jgi:zinc protease